MMEGKDYTEMWKSLGIDIKGHDELLKVLGQAYTDIFLSQKDRPKGMEYLDFVMSEIHGLRIEELLQTKEKGNKVIGTFCLYVPEEIILAAGGTCVGLCAGADIGTQEADKVLPANTCALIKSFMGFKLSHVCPYVEACDLVIGETTCDGKKKAYEIFGDFKETFVIEVPQIKNAEGRSHWLSEIKRLMAKIEEISGRTIAAENLSEAVKTVNAKRAALQRLARLRKAKLVPISGLDSLLINQVQFYDDPKRFTEKINDLCTELETRIGNKEGVAPENTPRILMSGCPMAAPNWKVPFVVEKQGAVIVGEESCVGERGTRNLVPENGRTRDELLSSIADRYFRIDCACFTPNQDRLNHIIEMAQELKADGVIHYTLQFCTPYMVESYKVGQALEKENIPLLKVETDYSTGDIGQIETRVAAFIEMIGGK